MVAAIAPALEPDLLARGGRELFDRPRGYGGGMVTVLAGFSTDCFGTGPVAGDLQMSAAIFQGRITQIGNPGLDRLIETGKALSGLTGPPGQLCDMAMSLRRAGLER